MTGRAVPIDRDPYDAAAEELAARYEGLDVGPYRQTSADRIPDGGSRLALDVGAGSGRDAAWLAELGFDVVAAEPEAGMRRAAVLHHPEAAVRWVDDRLPGLERVHALGLSFDLILLAAVWQHVAPADRQRAFRRLATLIAPGGVLVITLRHGAAPPGRSMHEVTLGELEMLARQNRLSVSRVERLPDLLGRSDVDWTSVCMTLPDDGAGALPLIRGVVLNDDKSSTYKLGLLRAIARVADLTHNLATPDPADDAVRLPLGAIALNWLRMYLPLVRAFRRCRGMPGRTA